MKRLRFGLWYDFRNPARWRRDPSDLYAGILEQVARAEQLGWDDVWLSEHHFVDDGYLPSCVPVAAAIAAKTKRMRIGTAILQLPLHDPVRLAEDAAVVDVISRGRLDLGLGLGYRPAEFAGYGAEWSSRAERLEEGLEILRALFSGETLDYAGRHHRLRGTRLCPQPVQRPLKLLIGGISEAALRRAARLGDGAIVSGAHDDGAGIRAYRDELEKRGREPGELIYFEQWLVVTREPEARLRQASAQIGYQMARYAAWARGDDAPEPAPLGIGELRAAGVRFLGPDEAEEHLRGLVDRFGIDRWLGWTLPPGLPPEWADEHLELMAREVLPVFR